jgi:hypothetical protein
MTSISETLAKLLETPESLLILLGAAFIALGASGGITYNNWFPITEFWGQLAISAAGLVLALGGILMVQQKPRSSGPYGISITNPKSGSVRETEDVRGSIKKRPPNDYQLWLLRFYPDGRYVPIQEVQLRDRADEWEVKDCDVGGKGKSNDKRTLAAYLVGPYTQELFKFRKEASDRYYGLIKSVEKFNDSIVDKNKTFSLGRVDGS